MKANDVLGYLTLRNRAIEGRRMFWDCECVCGKVVRRREDYLKYFAQGRDSSCGCMHPLKVRDIGSKHPGWKGCGDIPMQHFTEIKCRAEAHSLEFSITIEEVWCLFLEQRGLCNLTGLPLNFVPDKQKRRGKEQTASLDRIDSQKGYSLNNIQWIHKDVNRMKNAYSQNRFLEICKLVTVYSTKEHNIQ